MKSISMIHFDSLCDIGILFIVQQSAVPTTYLFFLKNEYTVHITVAVCSSYQ